MSGTAPDQVASAVAPRPGMRRIPFPLESYQHNSPPLSAKYLLNVYAEQQPADARTQAALISPPGLFPLSYTVGTGPILAMNSDQPGYIYMVSGSHLYRVTQPYSTIPVPSIVDLGEIGVATLDDFEVNTMVTLAVGVNAVVVCVPPRAFTCSHFGTLNEIGGDFPGARSVTYLDGYFVFTANEISSQFFISRLLDPNDFDALDFAYADGVPNVLRRVMTLRGELWFLGESAVEIWYNAGAADFPFRRQSGGVIPYGCKAIKSAAIIDGSLFWLSSSDSVLRSVGYKAERVSSHAIETRIRNPTQFNMESALAYASNGHSFYVMNYEEALGFRGGSLVYDSATRLWHDRSSSPDGSDPWLASAVAQNGANLFFGSRLDGAIYVIDRAVDTDAGHPVPRQVIMPPLWAGTRRAYCSRLEIELETGGVLPTGAVTLDWSDNGGLTWDGGPRVMDAGSFSGYRGRVFTTRLGSFRQRIFRITTQHNMTLYAVDADIIEGGH